MTKDEQVNVIKNILINIETTAAMAGIAMIPYIGPVIALPVINQIVSSLVGVLINLSVQKEEMLAFCAYIDLRTSQEGRDYLTAVENESKAVTPNEKAIALQNRLNAFKCLVKLTN